MPQSPHSLLHPLDLPLPNLPAALEGFRIAHLTDLHVRRRRPRHHAIAAALATLDVHLLAITGDYMQHPGDEAVALDVMQEICAALRPRLGTVAVFGNHDSEHVRALMQQLPVRWLRNAGWRPADLPLLILGADATRTSFGDSLALLHAATDPHANGAPRPRPLRLLLSHYPMYLPTAADLGIDLMLSGHTHGGQCRLPTRHSLVNSSDLPLQLTSGILRHRDTLCAVSRGLGESMMPLRLFCPPHIPVYTLRRGPLPGRRTEAVENALPW